MKKCCKNITKNTNRCTRKDGKIFSLPRKFTKSRCITGPIRGFTMRSSCAPYKFCKTNNLNGGTYKKEKKKKKKKKSKKIFLYNPHDPKRSFDVYIDKNPHDTIHIKYKSIEDVTETIKKLEKLYKGDKYSHKRIWQVGMIMYVRLKVLKEEKQKQFKLSERYFKFLGERTKINSNIERKRLKFKF